MSLRKIEKAEHLEGARVLLITAHDLITTAERMVADVHDGPMGFQHVKDSLMYLTCKIVELQNKLHGTK